MMKYAIKFFRKFGLLIHLSKRYDDLYRLTLEFTDGKTGATRDTVVERSVGDFIDENGLICQVSNPNDEMMEFLTCFSSSGYRGAPCVEASQVLVCCKERQIDELIGQQMCTVPVD